MVYIYPEVDCIPSSPLSIDTHVQLKRYVVRYRWPKDRYADKDMKYYYPRPQLLYPRVEYVPKQQSGTHIYKAPMSKAILPITSAPKHKPPMPKPRTRRVPAPIPIIDPNTGKPVPLPSPPFSDTSSTDASSAPVIQVGTSHSDPDPAGFTSRPVDVTPHLLRILGC